MNARKLVGILYDGKHGFDEWWDGLLEAAQHEILDQIDNAIIKDAKEGGE